MYQLTFHDEKTDAVITIQGGTVDEQWNILSKVLEIDYKTAGVEYKGKWSLVGHSNPSIQEEEDICQTKIPYGFKVPREPIAI